ncbi:hypothetical protein CC80DRAFT_493599 [Byssothecium circinans]|uniref:Uncharacterized protein n=1 Tax=Byssothecium circinans TaxID=147558 RepID=A0A6A5TSY6_9PLEO|nr:hypothetical protein CC80DRAFT_493599 [Byssothecium circinans]
MMRGIIALALSIATILVQPGHAANSRIVPCAMGFGEDNGCSYCEGNKSIEVTSWDQPTTVKNFNMESAASKSGAGYDVWWNVQQPAQGCRILLFEPYNTDRGSINSKLAGNVVLSVAHGGCYFSNVGSRGISVGACCNGDCSTAGAVTSGKKRRARRSMPSENPVVGTDNMEARSWRNPNPNDPPSPPPDTKPGVTCSKPAPDGFTYTKAGKQVVYGDTLNCGNSESCSRSVAVSVSVTSTLSNEKSITKSEGNSVSLSLQAGYSVFPAGPSGSITSTFSKEWSNAVTEGMSMSESRSVTDTVTLSFSLKSNVDYNGWFTPTLKCQAFKLKCTGDVEFSLEKCEPLIDSNNKPSGETGVMVIG